MSPELAQRNRENYWMQIDTGVLFKKCLLPYVAWISHIFKIYSFSKGSLENIGICKIWIPAKKVTFSGIRFQMKSGDLQIVGRHNCVDQYGDGSPLRLFTYKVVIISGTQSRPLVTTGSWPIKWYRYFFFLHSDFHRISICVINFFMQISFYLAMI